ncbi:MAG: Isoleucine-tRNA ligase [Candidatus Wolfebacteria bacterium GW2011_GWC2_39_22]|uniref:Isoleucine--tRNA ligase n=1 Tax=Candidatus Wolfebacteria bacterium GW2011_GWC2_39_22 TaxID=1619013 RepID=A0A0G0N9R1_9BACT|nr:MAG: Isoleucine-tRNA ligase [Candidatus Wolfebacteria bacterium GW2011_GWC2_39_22]HBI25203.1 isoleucine--tRNA ligase [Candidatus Wolfebacteria bacterium]
MLKGRKKFTPSEVELEVLEFWKQDKTFERSVKKPAPKGDYVFYDGPPFATGLPHYGHILASVIKDAVPRYQTMNGKRVTRRWGWDCHGLPVENLIEKELGLQTKKDIENIGIETFNEAARGSVMAFAHDWKNVIPRIGRWVEMEQDYKTMDTSFTESVMWVFKTLYDKGLVYEGFKSMHVCPRCETSLSNFEVALNYKDIDDISTYVKFAVAGEKNTYFIAWTTTPWTLPGNVALAVNAKVEYVKIAVKNETGTENYILAKDRLELIEGEYTILETVKGKDLVGKAYVPMFDYYQKGEIENRENGWKVYPGDFVTMEDGSGIVHIAPAFGSDDMELARVNKLPFVQHVGMDGHFKAEVVDFPGLAVKPRDDHKATDIEVIKWLAHHNNLLKKQKLVHSYPHCWRCETPLLNYATSSWFVEVTKIRDTKNGLVENNKKINWVPEHIKTGRFGNWVADARDWAVSRTRFWGAPLPVWRCQECGELKVIGSVAEIKKNGPKSGNTYFTLRHGQSENNAANIVNSNPKTSSHLTEKGKKQVDASVKAFAKQLKGKKIDIIFASDFMRAQETAAIAAKVLGYDAKIVTDKRLREINCGIFNERPLADYHAYFASMEEKFDKGAPKGENLTEVKKRMTEFVYDIDKKYAGKNILIVSHEYPIWALFAGVQGYNAEQAVAMRKGDRDFIVNAEIKKLDFSIIPHNKNYELDLHRPYIDRLDFTCSKGHTMKRVPDVFDCWFESGSMPYGQAHYPFENKKKFEKQFPAEFIAEGVDQTRGWFYNLLALSTGLFGKPAFKNVVVTGMILAEDGQKMSKKLKNYPDPMEMVQKYGADALRLYLLSSPVVRAETLQFSEKGVDELYKKVIARLWNVYSFYDMYGKEQKVIARPKGKITALDAWMLGRLDELIAEVTASMNSYELDRAVRPIGQFVDDLSTWYVRRSRRRFQKPDDKKDWELASKTLAYVLFETSKVLAPFTPFFADALYKSLNQKKNASVHLENWTKSATPVAIKASMKAGIAMGEVRTLASLALAKRAQLGIKVRQPLSTLTVQSTVAGLKTNKELLEILADEVNVKKIIVKQKVEGVVEFDTRITPELLEEGIVRESVRMVQGLRQDAGYEPKDRITLFVDSAALGDVIKKHETLLKKEVGAKSIVFAPEAEHIDAYSELVIDGERIWFGIKK